MIFSFLSPLIWCILSIRSCFLEHFELHLFPCHWSYWSLFLSLIFWIIFEVHSFSAFGTSKFWSQLSRVRWFLEREFPLNIMSQPLFDNDWMIPIDMCWCVDILWYWCCPRGGGTCKIPIEIFYLLSWVGSLIVCSFPLGIDNCFASDFKRANYMKSGDINWFVDVSIDTNRGFIWIEENYLFQW